MKILNKIASIIFILTLTSASAQDENIKNIKIHFNGEFNLVSFYMNVGGMDSLNFLFDTGFDVNVLDQGVAEQLNLDLSSTITEAQPGGEITYSIVNDLAVVIEGRDMESENFIVTPISQLGQMIGQPIHGILGMEFMKKYIIILNYEESSIAFQSLLQADDLKDYSEIEMQVENNQPFVFCMVESAEDSLVQAKFKIDTGSLSAIGFNKNYLIENTIINDNTFVVSKSGLGIGGETDNIVFRLGSLNLAAYHFSNLPAGATMDSGGFENRDDAGTLGGELIHRFNWIFDFKNSLAFIASNSYVDDAFIEDQSGIWVIETDTKEKMIYKIVKNSPGDQAGLKEGMWIERIDGINAIDIPLFELTQILKQEDGTQVSIEVKDADIPVIIELKSMI
jgi:predicted aspartyl protease